MKRLIPLNGNRIFLCSEEYWLFIYSRQQKKFPFATCATERSFPFRSRSINVQRPFNCRVTSVLLKRPFRSRSIAVQLPFYNDYNFILLKRPFRSRSRSVQPSMVFTAYTKRRILLYHGQGLCAPTIAKLLEDEGIIVSRRGVAKFILRVSCEVYITRESHRLHRSTSR